MNPNVEQVLKSYDALPECDRRLVAIEILRRGLSVDEEDVSDQTFVEAAEELFLRLDAAEAGHAQS